MELENRSALEQNSVVAMQQMKEKLETSEQALSQLRMSLKASQNKLDEHSSAASEAQVPVAS